VPGAPPVPGRRVGVGGADASEQIALEIRRYVERNALNPGDRIGTEQGLAMQFGASRPTVREAVRLLASRSRRPRC
jgi:GntR family transcriptional regulator, transcriptional repressor for pyruvate dehydrogenase complex